MGERQGEMPKEVVATADQHDVEVAWGRDAGYVQVGTVAAEHHSLEEFLEHARAPENDGPGVAAQYRGLFGTLDRNGVNHLIRVLRRARDQAFGRDE